MSQSNDPSSSPPPPGAAVVPSKPAPALFLTAFRLGAIWLGGAAVRQVAQDMLPTQYAMMSDPMVFGSIGLAVGTTVWGFWVRRKEMLDRIRMGRLVPDTVAVVVSWPAIVAGWFSWAWRR